MDTEHNDLNLTLDRGAGLYGLIDLAVLGTIKRYYRDPASPVTQILLVRTYLAEIAALFITEPIEGMDERKQALQAIFSRGLAHWGEDNANMVDIIARRVIELESIPDEQPCRVIYAPPIYFAQPIGWFCDSEEGL